MEFTNAATSLAKSLVKSAELADMINHKNIFVFDIKGRLSTDENKKILDALMELKDTLPSLSPLESFSLAIDSQLMKLISQDKSSSKIMYTHWVKSNAKLAKTLLATRIRSAKNEKHQGCQTYKAEGAFGQSAHEEEGSGRRLERD